MLPHVPASKLRRARQLHLIQEAHQQRARQLHLLQQAHQQRAKARQQPKGQQSLSATQTRPPRRQPSAAAMNPLPLPRPPLPHLPAPPRRPRLTSSQVLEESPTWWKAFQHAVQFCLSADTVVWCLMTIKKGGFNMCREVVVLCSSAAQGLLSKAI